MCESMATLLAGRAAQRTPHPGLVSTALLARHRAEAPAIEAEPGQIWEQLHMINSNGRDDMRERIDSLTRATEPAAKPTTDPDDLAGVRHDASHALLERARSS